MVETLRTLVDGATFDGYLARSWQPESIADLDRRMDLALDGAPTASGANVTPRTAMGVSVVWSCIQAISGDMAKLKLRTYRRDKDDNRTEARDHYLYPLLTETANPEMSAFRFKRQMQTWALMYGNAYAEVVISGRGQVKELWPWHPARTEVSRPEKGGPLVYTFKLKNGEKVSKPDALMFHLRGLETDGVMGLSPIEAHRQRIGMSMATERHGAEFFGNGARPLGVLQTAGNLGEGDIGDKATAEIRRMWQAAHGGPGKAHRIAILEEGLEYKETGLSMVDAQYIQGMEFGIEELARIYGVPPHRIGHLARATNNNIEHQGREYVQSCIGQWGSNWEAEVMISLLSETERQTVFLEFDYSEYLKGDYAAEAEYIRARWNTGSITADEIRKAKNENPLPNGMGSRPRVPANTIWSDEPTPPQSAAAEPAPSEPKKPKRYVNGHAADASTALLMHPGE